MSKFTPPFDAQTIRSQISAIETLGVGAADNLAEFLLDFSEASDERVAAALNGVMAHRARFVWPERPRFTGRALVYFGGWTLSHGFSVDESQNLFDMNDCPVNLVWLIHARERDRRWGHLTSVLVSWIPAELMQRAQNAIDVNAEDCIVWADNPLARTFEIVKWVQTVAGRRKWWWPFS